MKEESNRKKLLSLYPDNNELVLFDKLSHYIQNFRNGFKKTTNMNTLVLSPEGSDIFPLEIIDKLPTLGVPDDVFQVLVKTPLYNFNIIEDTPGLFMMVAVGVGDSVKPIALRIYKRKAQSLASSRYDQIRLCRIDENGRIYGFDIKNSFILPLSTIKTVDW